MKGKIKWFNMQKGFGFIEGEDGKDCFLHITQLPEGVEVNEGTEVEYNPVPTDKGVQAQNVEIVGEGF